MTKAAAETVASHGQIPLTEQNTGMEEGKRMKRLVNTHCTAAAYRVADVAKTTTMARANQIRLVGVKQF